MKHLFAAVMVLSGGAVLAGPAIPIVYDPPTDITVTDLGSLGGVWSEANDINNRGIVVGWSNDAAGVAQAFYYLDGAMRLLDPGIGPHTNAATGINDRDEIVGAMVHLGEARAFLADVGSSGVLALLDRGSGERGINSTVAAISDSSLVVGQRDVPGEQVANIWPDLYTYRTVEREAVVNDVNSAGVTVGHSTYDGMIFVWRWSKDGVVEECMPRLEPTISCFSNGDLLGVNNSGEIVGYTRHGFGGANRAIYWNGHGVFSRQLGLLPTGTHSVADDINEDGFIAGYADRVTGGFKLSLDTAFLFHWDFGMVALPRPKFAAWFGHCRAKALNDRNAATGVIQVVGTCDTLLGTSAVRWDMKVPSRLLVPLPPP